MTARLRFDELENVVDALVAWNDGHLVETNTRIMKLTEENGEAMQAWFGYNGYNPRKGYTCDLQKVIDELGDVALAALVAIASLDPGRLEIQLCNRAQFVAERLGIEVAR